MESRAKFLGHPIHQMLIVFPLGLLAMAVVFDALALARDQPYWFEISYWMMIAGLIGGLVAARFGTIDWLAIAPRTRAKRVGALHGGGNVLVTLLFAASWFMRRDTLNHEADATALTLSFIAGALALVTGWLGGELVDRLAIGVDEGAHADAPSSLRARHARV